MLPLSDGTLLLLNTCPGRRSKAFRIGLKNQVLKKIKWPGDPKCWAVPAPPDRVLLGHPEADHCVLWNPITRQAKPISAHLPRGFTVCSDTHNSHLVIIVNWNVSGASSGFDWSDDDTCLAVFDLDNEQFIQPFQAVEDNDLRAIVMQDEDLFVGFGFGRSSHFISLFNKKLKPQLTGREHWSTFRMSHFHQAAFVGTDTDKAMVMFGSKGNSEERALMRWTLVTQEFETVGIIGNTDLFFRCATPLNDGSILLFLGERFSPNIHLYRYATQEPLRCIGRLMDVNIECAGQASDGRIYVASGDDVHIIAPPTQDIDH
jgi:hypothetical protein